MYGKGPEERREMECMLEPPSIVRDTSILSKMMGRDSRPLEACPTSLFQSLALHHSKHKGTSNRAYDGFRHAQLDATACNTIRIFRTSVAWDL
jgi:hypothetical protein